MHEQLYTGVTFETVRWALANLYFYNPSLQTQAEVKAWYDDKIRYVLPMQHNFENPLAMPDAKDTFIEYWIVDDDRLVHDVTDNAGGLNKVNSATKVATIDLRFVGAQAEIWAKAMHHIKQRVDVRALFLDMCKGEIFDYVGPIRPTIVDYFGGANASIAFDMTIKIQYRESLVLTYTPLEYLSVPDLELSGGIADDDTGSG